MQRTTTGRQLAIFLALNLLFTLTLKSQINGNKDVYYVSPSQGSFLNNPSTNILIKYRFPVKDISAGYTVRASGKNIDVNYKLLNDDKTVLIQPINALPTNVSIDVYSNNEILLEGNIAAQQLYFNFYATDKMSSQYINNEQQLFSNNSSNAKSVSSITDSIANQIPFTVTANNHTSKGYYFISSIITNSYLNQSNRCMILDSNGKIIFDRKAPSNALDFKKISDSTFSYFNVADFSFRILDLHFNEIDRIVAGNGYITDVHDLQYDKKTGHYFLLAQENVTVNMSDSVLGGDTAALVTGLIIQELDKDKNVVFEWKTLDYLPITASVGQNLLASTIDYIHCNSIDIETDSTLLLSSRHLNEIDRIDRRTGALIWRFGLHSLNNDFSFTNDTIGFTYQHDARRLPNGHITLYDDGNLRTGSERYSRAVEYSLDEVNCSATLVWEYRNTPDVNSYAMGNVQRLPNKNNLIGWGLSSTIFTEVDSNNNKVLEITTPQMYSYRAFRFDIQDIVNLNQIPLDQSGLIDFCNQDTTNVYKNLNTFLLPQNFNSTDSVQFVRTGNVVDIYTMTSNDFYNSAVTNLNFYYSKIVQNDTTICKGSSLKLNVIGNCKNASYVWSTSDSGNTTNISPNISSPYWVEIRSGNYVGRDTINVSVSSVPDFTINGNQNTTINKIDTFWVPYDSDAKYTWNIKNANIVSVLNNDTIIANMNGSDTVHILSVITNKYGCSNSGVIKVAYLKSSSGINEINSIKTFSVYPNPVSQNVFIDGKEDFIYKLYDMNGKNILQSKSASNGHEQINLEALHSGSYVLLIISGDRTEKYKVEKL